MGGGSLYFRHAQRDDLPGSAIVAVFSADILLGLGRLVALLDDTYTLDESLVARLFGHFAQLQHAACLEGALLVARQEAQHRIDQGAAVLVLGHALDILLDQMSVPQRVEDQENDPEADTHKVASLRSLRR